MIVSNPLSQVSEALNCTIEAFSNAFMQAQTERLADIRTSLEAVADFSDEKSQFMAGLEFALENNFYNKLLDILIDENLINNEMLKVLANNGHPDIYLQAMRNDFPDFIQPGFELRGNRDAMRWTGKVTVDGVELGSGVLIGPDLFLTAWHVVKNVFTKIQNGFLPTTGAGNRISITFDEFSMLNEQGDRIVQNKSLRVDVVSNDWCITFSPSHDSEFLNAPPIGTDLDDHWDYVVLRLNSPIGIGRKWANLNNLSISPRFEEFFSIYQYPDGKYLVSDRGRIQKSEVSYREFIPKLRFLHKANTLGGSSGAPCFDKSFSLFGIHQGKWDNSSNRGIPLLRILEDIKKKINELPGPDPSKVIIWNLGANGNLQPVLGTKAFQILIWRSLSGDTIRLIEISGNKGSGKSYLVKLLSTILKDGAHLKLFFEGIEISKMDVMSLAIHICVSAKAKVPDFLPLNDFDTAITTWITSEIIPKTLAALEEVKENRMVWLVFRNLNAYHLDGSGVSDFLTGFYQRLPDSAWMRIVLDGMQGDLPYSIEEVVSRYKTRDFEREDFLNFLKYLFEYIGLVPQEKILNYLSRDMYTKYTETLRTTPDQALRESNFMLKQLIDDLTTR